MTRLHPRYIQQFVYTTRHILKFYYPIISRKAECGRIERHRAGRSNVTDIAVAGMHRSSLTTNLLQQSPARGGPVFFWVRDPS